MSRTKPLTEPPKKDPRRKTHEALVPPPGRSRAALAMSASAARSVLTLQRCRDCGRVQYPARDACGSCLSVDLAWVPVPPDGELIAETTVRTSTEPYFRERTPWRVGTVSLAAGPTVLAYLHGEVGTAPAAVQVFPYLDRSGNAVLMALPVEGSPAMNEDRQLRELTADPKYRRVLITDGRNPVGRAVARALSDAGASIVFVGIAEAWKGFAERDELLAIPKVEIMDLDVTDTTSVEALAGEIGGKTDILINTADHVRAGGVMSRNGVTTARDELDINVLGLMRLAQAFGPTMSFRGADQDNSAAAFVNILSCYALSNWPAYGGHSISQAAALSALQCLRAELRPGGIRVISLFTGPVEDPWYQTLPPPKVAPAAIAAALVQALRQGTEDVAVGDIAKDVLQRFAENPKVLERELGQ
ncbi:MAG: SDR family oxidoreductase [Kiloniellales bacterium]